MEIFCVQNANIFILDIPPKYHIESSSQVSSYKIKELKCSVDGTLDPGQYGNEPEALEIEKDYEEVDLEEPTDEQDGDGKDLQSKLEEKYNRPVKLTINKQDQKDIQSILRQTSRLKYCTQNIPYNIAILVKNYLCIGKDEGDTDSTQCSSQCYFIKNYSRLDVKQLYIAIGLKKFYDKMNTLCQDIVTIRTGIYNILDKNQHHHTTLLQKLLDQRSDYEMISYYLQNRKQEYLTYLAQLQEMLHRLNNSEKKMVRKIMDLEKSDSKGAGAYQNLHHDIQYTHTIKTHQETLERMLKVKQEIIRNLLTIQSKLDDLTLYTDKVMFDTNVMVDCIQKNFKKLSEF